MRPRIIRPNQSGSRPRGVTIVQVAIFAPVAVAFTALAVDVGMLLNAQGDLQRAADSAALAGASSYISDAGLEMNKPLLALMIEERSQAFSLENPTLWISTILDEPDIAEGTHQYDSPGADLYDGPRWNGAEVLVRREPGSSNGAVAFFFARIFGMAEGGVTANARAIFDDHVGGYQLDNDGGFLPFTIHKDIYADMVQNGPDDYSYNDGGNVDSSPDDVNEIKLFPWKWTDEDEAVNGGGGGGNGNNQGNDAAGNFGTLNIGIENQGTTGIEEQIVNGISQEQLEAEFGVPKLTFFNDGQPLTHDASGNPGLSTSLKAPLADRVGDIVGFFLHQDSYDTGSNTIFVITAVRFARIMHVDLTGNPSQRTLTLQPVAWTDGNVILDPDAPSTNGEIGRLVLVK